MKMNELPSDEKIERGLKAAGWKNWEIKVHRWVKNNIWQASIIVIIGLAVLAQIKYNDLLLTLNLIIAFLFGFGGGMHYVQSKNTK